MQNQLINEISQLIAPLLASLDVEIVEIERDHKTLCIYIYKVDGVTIKLCQDVLQIIRPVLEVHELIDDNWNLEVASPGIDRPLTTIADFRRNLGRTLEITFQTNDEIVSTEAVIEKVSSSEISLRPIVEKKRSSSDLIKISIDDVRKAKIKLIW